MILKLTLTEWGNEQHVLGAHHLCGTGSEASDSVRDGVKVNKLKGPLMINKNIKSFLRFNITFCNLLVFFSFQLRLSFNWINFHLMILKIVALGTYFYTKLCIYFQTFFFFPFALTKGSNLNHKPQKSVDGIGTLDRLNNDVKTIHNITSTIKLKY